MQVHQGGWIIDREPAHIANPGGDVRNHHRFAACVGGKTAFTGFDPTKVAVRADFGDFGEGFGRSVHTV